MYRTEEEERQYRRLDKKSKRRYDLEADMDPSVSHSKIMQMLSLNNAIEETMKVGGGNPNSKSPETQRETVKKAEKWLREKSPTTWEKVKNQFQQVIDYLGDLVAKGIKWVGKKIEELWDILFG